MADPIVQAATALVWLTRLPVGRWLPETPPPLAAAAWAFPLVGVVVGAGAGLVLALAAGLGLPPLACALLALAAGMALTGALPRTGWPISPMAAGPRPRPRVGIMRDSRIGSYGTIALLLSLGLRAAALAALAPGQGGWR
ncbi:adenosylcobinamide-GDP ribazoletransferase [Paracoccus mutanolyticus]|uniref:adenosylcobinamide-GDP ribazoletransferase n=1 Tax=Paracoccus mutanolyticus TaxID=1499308 RepID=UPI001CB98246|nr:adenosylcobinamide-GDP ribazoletransferase [Paracoccus mutanolyticus]